METKLVNIKLTSILMLFFACLSVLAGVLSATAHARQKSETQTIAPGSSAHKLEVLLDTALKENPGIRAAFETYKKEVENYRVETGYPDPQISMTYFTNPIETRLGPQDYNLTLSQKIPFPGKLGKAGDIVESDIRIAKLKLDKKIKQTAKQVIDSYAELLYIRTARKVARKNTELIQQLESDGSQAWAQDRAALLDMMRATSRKGQSMYDEMLLEELEQVESANINSLLDRSPGTVVQKLDTLDIEPVRYSLDEMYRIAGQNNEDILLADVAVEKAENRMELSSFAKRPDFNMGIFYAGIGEPDTPVSPEDAGEDAFGIRFGVNIPIWTAKNAGREQSAFHAREQAAALKRERINTVRTDIRASYFRLKNSERLISLYKDNLIPQALKSVETAETWFRHGEGTLSDLIEARNISYNFQLSLARARADYIQHLAFLENLAGKVLTRKSGQQDTGEKK